MAWERGGDSEISENMPKSAQATEKSQGPWYRVQAKNSLWLLKTQLLKSHNGDWNLGNSGLGSSYTFLIP